MKLKIKQVNKIAMGLRDLGEIKMSGPLKFKIIRNTKMFDDILEDVVKANNNDVNVPVELLENEIDIEPLMFSKEELTNLEVSANTLYQLYEIIEGVDYEVTTN